MKRLGHEPPEFPFEPGEAVGHIGRHARVVRINPRDRHHVKIRYTDFPQTERWVSLGQIHEPPLLPEHLRKAGEEVAGLLRDPHSIFEDQS